MDSFKGMAFFYDATSKLGDFSNVMGLAGIASVGSTKILFANEPVTDKGHADEMADFLSSKNVFCVFAQSFGKGLRDALIAKKILPIEIRRKDLQEIFSAFSQKDTEATVFNEFEGGSKLKLVSGSFSKSYIFRMDDAEKEIVADDGWGGFAK